MKKVILYYKYIKIDHPLALKNSQFKVCKRLNLKGRVIISQEGINGTLSGKLADIEEYKKELISNALFSDIIFKESSIKEDLFPRLSIKVRDEIVSLNQKIDITTDGAKKGEYISPEDFHKIILENNSDTVIIDARNNYESYIGRFKNSITPNIDNFRDFPKVINDLKKYKGKKIVMYCTGGVRCEKASAFLLKKGFKNIYQLKEGILNYANYYPEDFEGKCYVFDKRVSINLDAKNRTIISKCRHCNEYSDQYINCQNKKCNLQFVCCNVCEKKFHHTCSLECIDIVIQAQNK
jgi:UPF0176 protein